MSKNRPSKSSPPSASPAKKDLFEKLGNKGVFLALGLILLVTFFIFKDFILLKKLYLYKDIGSDTLNGDHPFFYNFANYFHRYGLPTWSFQEGMGQNVVGGFLRDPFMLIAYLAGPSSMPKIYIYIALIKIIAAGLVFYLFLKQLNVSNFAATLGTLLFSFSGFMIIGSCWYVFTYQAFTLALALLGFELYFQKGKWLTFVIAIFCIGISMPFDLYAQGMILLFYILFRLGQTNQLNLRSFLQIILRLAVLGIIGVLLSAPFFMEAALQLVESPRGSGATSYTDILSSKPMFALIDKFQFGTFITRLFSNDYLGSGSNFKGWQNFLEAPVSYCGIISVLLMPQVFTSVSRSARKWYIIWLLIWLIPSLFPYFRYAFWLFAGDYYRIFSFCLSFVFILYSTFAIDLILKTKKINKITLILSLVLSFFLLSINYFKGTPAETDDTISLFVKVFLVAYACLLFFITKQPDNTVLKYVLLLLICVELSFLSSFSVNRRDTMYTRELSEKVGYNDYSIEAVDYIKKHEKGFYRIDKNYYSSGTIHLSLSENKIHDYYGTSSYSSFNNNNYINFLREYGIIGNQEHESRWAPGLINRPILQSLNQVTYIMAKGYSNPVWHSTHDSVAKFGDVLVLKSKFTLPLGYTYKRYVKQDDFERLSMNQKDFVSLKALVLKDEDIEKAPGLIPYNIADTINNMQFSFENYKSDISRLSQNTLKISEFSDTKIKGEITSDSTQIMYLSFPYDKGWHLNMDGAETPLLYVNNGMTGVYLPKGHHKVELNYELRMFNKGLIFVPVGIVLILILLFLERRNKNILKVPTGPVNA